MIGLLALSETPTSMEINLTLPLQVNKLSTHHSLDSFDTSYSLLYHVRYFPNHQYPESEQYFHIYIDILLWKSHRTLCLRRWNRMYVLCKSIVMLGGFIFLTTVVAMDPTLSVCLGNCHNPDCSGLSRSWINFIKTWPRGCKVHNFGGLVAIRLCLGFCEGGLLPGMVSKHV